MNLINCSANCEYQLEGYCNLKDMFISQSDNNVGCCYYKEKECKNLTNKQDNSDQKSEF